MILRCITVSVLLSRAVGVYPSHKKSAGATSFTSPMVSIPIPNHHPNDEEELVKQQGFDSVIQAGMPEWKSFLEFSEQKEQLIDQINETQLSLDELFNAAPHQKQHHQPSSQSDDFWQRAKQLQRELEIRERALENIDEQLKQKHELISLSFQFYLVWCERILVKQALRLMNEDYLIRSKMDPKTIRVNKQVISKMTDKLNEQTMMIHDNSNQKKKRNDNFKEILKIKQRDLSLSQTAVNFHLQNNLQPFTNIRIDQMEYLISDDISCLGSIPLLDEEYGVMFPEIDDYISDYSDHQLILMQSSLRAEMALEPLQTLNQAIQVCRQSLKQKKNNHSNHNNNNNNDDKNAPNLATELRKNWNHRESLDEMMSYVYKFIHERYIRKLLNDHPLCDLKLTPLNQVFKYFPGIFPGFIPTVIFTEFLRYGIHLSVNLERLASMHFRDESDITLKRKRMNQSDDDDDNEGSLSMPSHFCVWPYLNVNLKRMMDEYEIPISEDSHLFVLNDLNMNRQSRSMNGDNSNKVFKVITLEDIRDAALKLDGDITEKDKNGSLSMEDKTEMFYLDRLGVLCTILLKSSKSLEMSVNK